MTCPPPEQVAGISTRMGLESLSSPGEALRDQEAGRGILVQSKAILCPACGGILRVESYTSQRPGQEPQVRAVGVCTGRGTTVKADGLRWRPRAGCGRFVLE